MAPCALPTPSSPAILAQVVTVPYYEFNAAAGDAGKQQYLRGAVGW